MSNGGLKLKIEYRTGVKPNYNDGLKLKIEYMTGVIKPINYLIN